MGSRPTSRRSKSAPLQGCSACAASCELCKRPAERVGCNCAVARVQHAREEGRLAAVQAGLLKPSPELSTVKTSLVFFKTSLCPPSSLVQGRSGRRHAL